MSLRKQFALYLLFLHVVFAVVALWFLRNDRLWLLGVEAVFCLSLIAALKLFRSLFRPLEILTAGAELLRDGDYTTRFKLLGQPELDVLIDVYNRMADHLRAERVRIQEQHLFLEKILSVLPSSMIILDYDGNIAFINPAGEALLQCSLKDAAGKRLGELPSPLARTIDGLPAGQSTIFPLRGVRKARCYKASFLDQGHRRLFCIIEELTEELRKTEKAAFEKLIRMLSHEVNNSLGAANSLLHSCLRYKDQLREEDRADYEVALTVAISRAEHLASFMRSFADIVRLPLPQRQFGDVQALLRRITSLLSADLEKRKIDLRWDVQAAPEPVFMDEHQMEQVFLNILKNSTEAIDGTGTITIRFGRLNRRDFVAIEDTGGGISEEVRQNLFTPFFSTKEHGQGIGLTLCQEILMQHRFEFSLESTADRMTRFTVFLA